jgi:hypothetical protein
VRRNLLFLLVFSVCGLHAQTSAGQVSDPAAAGTQEPATVPVTPAGPVIPPPPVEDKRAYGVLPNYRTAEASTPFQPLTAKQKMNIAFKDSFDGAVYPTAAIFSVIYQAENQNPSFGQGLKGYAKRVGAAFGDQMIGNMMTEGIAPSLLHQDPRYFRKSEGPKGKRFLYAATRIFVAPTDHDHMIFNFSEWGGNSVAVAVSNIYYRDGRNWQDNAQKLLVQCGTDALSNVLKEFWPDVKRALSKKKN